jgi:hypothetical protein
MTLEFISHFLFRPPAPANTRSQQALQATGGVRVSMVLPDVTVDEVNPLIPYEQSVGDAIASATKTRRELIAVWSTSVDVTDSNSTTQVVFDILPPCATPANNCTSDYNPKRDLPSEEPDDDDDDDDDSDGVAGVAGGFQSVADDDDDATVDRFPQEVYNDLVLQVS